MTDITLLSGEWAPALYYAFVSDDGENVVYRLTHTNNTWSDSAYDIKWVRSTKTWFEGPGVSDPFTLNSVDDSTTASSSVYNPVKLFGFNYNGTGKNFEFTSPHWEAPPTIETHGFDLTSAVLTYNFATNRLSWILPASFSSTSDPFIIAHRTDYLLDNDLWLPNTYGYTTYIIHTQGTPSTGNSSNDIIPGTWRIRRKISAPSGMTSVLASITFTQSEIDAYNAAAAAQAASDAAAAAQAALDAAAAAQAALDAAAAAQAAADAAAAAQAAADAAAAAGSNAPPNTPRRRRGNHNFW